MAVEKSIIPVQGEVQEDDPELIVMPTTVGVGKHGKSYGRAMNLGGNGV